MSKNLAIIGASYLQLPLIEKAKDMGYKTHVFAWKANDVGEYAADFFYPISIVEKEKILEKCREIGICGICTIASDLAVVSVNFVSEKLGLCGNSIASTLPCTNKHHMRKAFEAYGDPSPKSVLVTDVKELSSLKIEYPVIVKPTDRSGSRGIFKIENPCDLENAVLQSMEQGFEKKVLVEEFAQGDEYSVEHISYRGEHHFLALTLKHTTGAPHFIETGHSEPAPVSDAVLEKVKNTVAHALDSLNIINGASHTEIKIDSQGNIKIIEIGARMGGDCIGSDLVMYSTGFDFVRMVIDVACGNAPDFTKHCEPMPVESVFIFTENDLLRFEKLQKENPDVILKVVDLHPENIGHITDSSNRAGCYIKKM